ncbi:phosphotransferase family protein [Clostridium sp. B9]|uniref:phosphotransferase family protein n=1 Tax=Clostridium sp. B9 TaxID=3423224 RepID=UPI003D2EF386
MSYTEEKIKKLISKHINLNNDIIINSIGNHHIGRHLVYRIDNGKDKFVFKSYYRNDKRERELNSLKILSDCRTRVPIIKDFGEYNNKQWILMDYIEGEVFENIYLTLNKENILRLFYELGEALGKIHSYKTFDYALNWNKSIGINDFKEYKIKKFEERVIEIYEQKSPYKELLIKGIKIVRKNYNSLFQKENFRLTHNDFDGRNVLVKNENGVYSIQAIIDFEQSYPDDYCNDLANLYFKYFNGNKDYEKEFLKGYNRYIGVDKGFYKLLDKYLILMVIEHCSWSYERANDYYMENIEFLEKLLNTYKN